MEEEGKESEGDEPKEIEEILVNKEKGAKFQSEEVKTVSEEIIEERSVLTVKR